MAETRRFSQVASAALCAGRDRDIYPENGRPRSKPIRVKLCPECPIRQECLEWALSAPYEPYGVWGGLDQDDVRALWFSQHPGRRG